MEAARPTIAAVFAMLALSVCATGCSGPEPDCSSDPEGCGGTLEFTVDETCPDAAAPLTVEIGEGEDVFMSLAEGAWPEVHYGNQGGQHVYLATVVEGAHTDVYDRLRYTFQVIAPRPEWDTDSACVDPLDPDRDAGGDGEGSGDMSGSGGGPDEVCWIGIGYRQAVVSADDPTVELAGFLVVLDYYDDGGPLVLEALVEDPCGRSVHDAHETQAFE